MASHNVSGRIEYELMSNNTALIRLITFSDPSAAQVDRCQVNFEIWNAAGTVKIAEILNVPRINGPATDPNFPQLTCPNTTMGEYVTSTIKRNIYEATYTFDPGQRYQIYAWDLSRIDNIINISNSGSASFFVKSELTVSAALASNRSPKINNDTILTACVQQPWFNNLDITDPDGDSLSFARVPCQQYDPPTIPSPITSAGYASPDTFGGGYFWVGPMGNVVWQNTSNILGPYTYALEIEEWRSGVQIGKVRYDATFFVVPGKCLVSSEKPLLQPQPKTEMTAFPNPTDDIINLTQKVDLVQLYDMQGKLLRVAERTDRLLVDDLPAGNYLLRVKDRSKGRSIRISIRR